MEKKAAELKNILTLQDKLLDSMLAEQEKIHLCVKNRSWYELNDALNRIRIISDDFVEADERRTALNVEKNVYFSKNIADIFYSVRSKLSKSKIENSALSKYVSIAKSFVSEVVEKCVPQQGNVLYTRNGQFTKPSVQSVLVNASF